MIETGAPGRIKVLRVIARLNIGGPARHVVLLDRGLRARGYETLLAHGSLGPGEASLEHLADQYGVPTVRVFGLAPRISPFRDALAFLHLLRLTFREVPDVVHTHTAKAGALGRLAAFTFNATRSRRRRALVVHTFHGHVLTGYFGPFINGIVRFAERSLAKITDRIVTISPAQWQDIVNRFRIAPQSRTVVIPLGLDLQPLLSRPMAIPTVRRDLGLGEDDLLIGYVGRFVPIKDLSTLIKAFAIVRREVPHASLLMAGDGPSRTELEELARRMSLGTCVRFLGWWDDLPPLYAAIDICALSSLNEGTPVAIIEAMAAGKAVVATNVGGVADVIEDGRTGLLVPPRDAEALARALVRLATDADLRHRMGREAKDGVPARFSDERLAVDVDALYSSALREKRGVRATT
jgi:glycosyltransferase involved in cell wall biosynthesis